MNRALQLAGLFGLDADDLDSRPPAAREAIALPRKGIVLLTGPSGAGKSTLLASTRAAIDASPDGVGIDENELSALACGRTVVECLDGSLGDALATLARAGLAEARVLARPPATLSVGQRARFDLARLLHHAERVADESASNTTIVILIDEFLSLLDRLTARAIALGLRRWMDRTKKPIVLLAATAHDDLTAALASEAHLHVDLDGSCERWERDDGATPDERLALGGDIQLERGSLRDYERIAGYHYRAGRPGTATQIHRAVFRPMDPGVRPITAGVLIVSYPPLAATARRLALGARYEELPLALRGRALNREVRTITRVIVDPRFRGLGVASRLVRRALNESETPYTEAFAVMGRLHPFFERAGMERIDPPDHPADARVRGVLESTGIDPALVAATQRFNRALNELAPPIRQTVEREIRRLAPGADQKRLDARLRAAVFGRPVYYLAHHP